MWEVTSHTLFLLEYDLLGESENNQGIKMFLSAGFIFKPGISDSEETEDRNSFHTTSTNTNKARNLDFPN